MIIFDLQCGNGHTFEGWFDGCQAYEEQKEKSMISCPICNDASVCRIPSTFGIKSSSPPQIKTDSPGQEPDMEAVAQKVIEFVDKNFDDVGCDFAKEALKIHYGVSELRNIKGTSTQEEEKVLKGEGIQFFKIPMPKPSDTDA